MADGSSNTVIETKQQRFERLLSCEPFKGLKAILDSLSREPATVCDGVQATSSYEELLVKLGYRVTLTKQIHIADAYSRMGRAGGIRVVLPYFDVPTQSSLPTLVSYDSSVTVTAKSAAFFNALLAELKRQLEI